MNEEQAEKIIELLKSIKRELISINSEISSIYSKMPDDVEVNERLDGMLKLLRDL